MYTNEHIVYIDQLCAIENPRESFLAYFGTCSGLFIDWIAHHLRAIIHNNMPTYKGPKAEQIALGLGVCAALCGTAYCLHKYISKSRSLLMAEAYEFDIEQQAIDVPVSFE